MGRTIRAQTNKATTRTRGNATARRLNELADLCIEKNIQKLEADGFKIEFHPSAFVKPVDQKTFDNTVKYFQEKATGEKLANKEFEETLFWSA